MEGVQRANLALKASPGMESEDSRSPAPPTQPLTSVLASTSPPKHHMHSPGQQPAENSTFRALGKY